MAYRSNVFTFTFQPLNHLRIDDLEPFQDLLEAQRGSTEFTLSALRRRMYWAVSLPLGVFAGDYRPSRTEFFDELAARNQLIERAAQDFNLRVPNGRGIIERGGVLYYHQHLIAILRRVHPEPAFFNALHVFLEAAQRNPTLIKGKKRERTPLPPTARPRINGRLARGLAWLPHEDLVLRQWFGPRVYGPDAGKHVALSDAEWDMVLEALGRQRTRGSVLARIIVLNQELRRELTVDGYIPKQRYAEYYQRVLGENPRPPRVAPARRTRAPRRPRASIAAPTAPAASPS